MHLYILHNCLVRIGLEDFIHECLKLIRMSLIQETCLSYFSFVWISVTTYDKCIQLTKEKEKNPH